jgi:acyl-CoA synthetase (NDP forming)
MVRAEHVCASLEDLAAAGAKNAVLPSSGFAEAGAAGEVLQIEVLKTAKRVGISIIGPNSLGIAHISRGWALAALPTIEPLLPGHVASISQSGAVCSEIAEYAVQQGIGLSTIAAVGNEAQIDAATLTSALVEDEKTRVIALFVESIRDPARFARAAEFARSRRKPIVILKIGASPVASEVAKAHTGSLVDDDKVYDAMCRRHAIVTVHTLEDLVTTAGLLAHTGVIERPGVAVVSLSGGGCGIATDLADRHGISLPAFSQETVAGLRELLPDYAATLNPFDITGAAFRDPDLFVRCIRIIGADPSIGLVVAAYSVFRDEKRLGPRLPLVTVMGEVVSMLGSRAVLASSAVRPYVGAGLKAMDAVGLKGSAFGGLAATMIAVRGALEWSELVRTVSLMTEPVPTETSTETPAPMDERQVLDFIASHHVPVLPAIVVRSDCEAMQAQQSFGGNGVLKILSPDIAHKTEVGGVKLNIAAEAVSEAHDALLATVRGSAPEARIDGVIVSPMRERGLELFVGVARDPQWGLVLAVGLGGLWPEVLKDTGLALLPLDRAEARRLLLGLRAAPLLAGHRGTPAVDLDLLADAIVRIGEAAISLGPALAALEVNPLRVSGHEVEALDGSSFGVTARDCGFMLTKPSCKSSAARGQSKPRAPYA